MDCIWPKWGVWKHRLGVKQWGVDREWGLIKNEIVSNRVMPWSNIHIILTLILSFYYLIHFIPIIIFLITTKTLKYIQPLTFTAVSLLLLQKTEKHSSFFTQAMKHFLMVYPRSLMVAVYKLAPCSIGAVSFLIEFMAAAGFILGR